MTHKFILLFISSLLLIACADESPMEAVTRDINEAERQYEYEQARQKQEQIQKQEKNACYNGTSSHSNSWCCTNYGYQCNTAKSSSSVKSSSSYYNYYYSSSSYKSSNSSTTSYKYLTQSKTMKFSLKSYKQTTSAWDGISAGGAYSDGDPSISFTIYFIDSAGQSSSSTTETLLSLQDKGSWSETVSKTISVPKGTQHINICPNVIDKDVFSNDDMSSGYCYTKYNIGELANNTIVKQNDSYASKYSLEWEWYLY